MAVDTAMNVLIVDDYSPAAEEARPRAQSKI